MAKKVTFISHKPSPFTKATIKVRQDLQELVASWPRFQGKLTAQDLGHILTTVVRMEGKVARLAKLANTEVEGRGLRLVGNRKQVAVVR